MRENLLQLYVLNPLLYKKELCKIRERITRNINKLIDSLFLKIKEKFLKCHPLGNTPYMFVH